MKKYKFVLCILALTMALASCESLDLAPEDYYGSNNFWNNEAQVKAFITGQHAQLRDSYVTLWLMGEARGGLQEHGTSSTATSIDYSSPFKDQDFTADKPGLSAWGGFYGRILNLNVAIDKLENEASFLTEESRNYYLGQVYGLRAFNYFWLYRTYGGVPLNTETKIIDGVTTAEPLYLERSSPRATMELIKSDIEKSETLFGDNLSITEGASIWSKSATLMLKAEVYLWSAKVTTGDQAPSPGDVDQAEAALRQVEGNFLLQENFSDVFAYNRKGNPEIIFALRFQENEATNWAANFVYSDNVFIGVKYDRNLNVMGDTLDTRGNGLLRHEYTISFFESFDDEDSRKTATFLDFYDRSEETPAVPVNGGLLMKKFMGILNNSGVRVYADDIPVYRYADVVLMLAEVENLKGGDPAVYINTIRQRAYGDAYNVEEHGYENGSYAENELAILMERDKEFVWEMKRWFDVRRLQDADGKPLVFSTTLPYGVEVPILDEETESHKVLWPVDVSTLGADPLLENAQTPGY